MAQALTCLLLQAYGTAESHANPIWQVFSAPNCYKMSDCRMNPLIWTHGVDIDPDVLYKGLTPAWLEAAQTAGG